jgi:predicted Zn-dependent protease
VEDAPGPRTDIAGRRRPRYTVALVAGVALLLGVGVAAALLVGRSRTPPPATSRASRPGPEKRARAPATVPLAPSAPSVTAAAPPGKDALAGMLESARQDLNQGRYKEALAGYQALLRQAAGDVDALPHVGLILAIGRHADSALERFDRIIESNPDHPLAFFYRGQVLYRAKQDYAGAIRDWERYLVLVPSGKEHDNVAAFLKEARARQNP